jgi:hypothetical protein
MGMPGDLDRFLELHEHYLLALALEQPAACLRIWQLYLGKRPDELGEILLG